MFKNKILKEILLQTHFKKYYIFLMLILKGKLHLLELFLFRIYQMHDITNTYNHMEFMNVKYKFLLSGIIIHVDRTTEKS